MVSEDGRWVLGILPVRLCIITIVDRVAFLIIARSSVGSVGIAQSTTHQMVEFM